MVCRALAEVCPLRSAILVIEKNTKPDINQSQLALYSWCCGGWRCRAVLEIHFINCSSWRDDVSLSEIDDVSLSDPKVPVDVIEVKRSLEVNLNFYSWSVHLSSGYFGTPGVLCVCSGWFLFPVGSTNCGSGPHF